MAGTHVVSTEQQVKIYNHDIQREIQQEIDYGWYVRHMIATTNGILVVFEKDHTLCGAQITCMACLALR